eukprot:TRINITY_DN2331_c0_g1_i3.p1 TRINITY_DN2331_c0_g1~~TRINITY_DN2331_c0_g1_i3.p1  ORF type:complete len:327 (-),score=36.27 TRINITY_DN2331_c0_g1_i3:31-1011(-)
MGLRIFTIMCVPIFLVSARLSKQYVHGTVAECDSKQVSVYADETLGGLSLLQRKFATEVRRSDEAVFLVGNGVLTEQQRDMLVNAPAHNVYRFNGMPGLRKFEPVGNVFVRSFSIGGKEGGYWGLSCCSNQSASCHWGAKASRMCSRISEAVSVILLAGTSSKADDFVRSCNDKVPIGSTFTEDKVVYLDGRKYASPPGYLYGWSSGFLGFVHMRTLHPHDDIHIMGMNWAAGGENQLHPFTVEKGIILEETSVSVRIHETATDAYHDNDVPVCQCSETQVANSSVDERRIQKVASRVVGTCSHGGSLLQTWTSAIVASTLFTITM